MRVVDLLFAFPSFVLALFLMVVLGFGVVNVVIAIALVYFPLFARLARNTALLVKEEPYVQAARLMGQSTPRILFREILPNIGAPILVQASVGVAFGVVIEAGLSFLGLGVQPPTPSLGVIMADGREYFQRGPWVLTLSGLFISIALLGLNLLGDGIRDLIDPRLRERIAAMTPAQPLVEIRNLQVRFPRRRRRDRGRPRRRSHHPARRGARGDRRVRLGQDGQHDGAAAASARQRAGHRRCPCLRRRADPGAERGRVPGLARAPACDDLPEPGRRLQSGQDDRLASRPHRAAPRRDRPRRRG